MANTPFSRLVRRLRKAGVRVEIREFPEKHAWFKGNRHFPVCGCFANHGQYSGYCDCHIVADHRDCLDKLSKCPLRMELPQTEAEARRIIAELRKLGTPEGFKASNTYAWLQPENKGLFPYSCKGLGKG